MSSSMWRQMMEEAATHLKEERYQEALDASRRVAQFDANNFQAFMCVGLASFHLQKWEDSEDAYRRAGALKPDLPAPWKNLVDLYDAQQKMQEKIEPLEKLIEIFKTQKKVKACQKWIADLASTVQTLKNWSKAFDTWFLLVNTTTSDPLLAPVCLLTTSNDELPPPLSIWLDLIDLLQKPGFLLSECASDCTISSLSAQFFEVAGAWNSNEPSPFTERVASATAFFFRHHLEELKSAPSDRKQALKTALDALSLSIRKWAPSAKLPCEYLLLRSEDSDSAITLDQARAMAMELRQAHAKSPMVLMFEGFELVESHQSTAAREVLSEALAGVSSSSFSESSLNIQVQIVVASMALEANDVEGCLKRLAKAREVCTEKHRLLGSAAPHPAIFSKAKAQLIEAHARQQSGALDVAMPLYQLVLQSTDDPLLQVDASICAAELWVRQQHYDQAAQVLNQTKHLMTLSHPRAAIAQCTRGWILFCTKEIELARVELEQSVVAMAPTASQAKALALKRLAIVYWTLDGITRREKAYCFTHLLQAAKLNPQDGEVFAWLGKWYVDVANDKLRSEKCFVKALALDATNELAGKALSELYEAQNKHEQSVLLWEQLTSSPENAPVWALLRLAQHLVNLDDERAVSKLHLVLRNDPTNRANWCIMGYVYRHFGKLVAAQKSYLRAIELGESHWTVLVELARIEATLHQFDQALDRIRGVYEAQEQKDVVALLYADILYQQAKALCADGLFGHAASNIQTASSVLKSCTSPLAATPEALKLLGDVHCMAFYLSPVDFDDWTAFLRDGRKAFEAAIVLLQRQNVSDELAEAYYDAGMGCWYEALAQTSSLSTTTDQTIQELQSKAQKYMQLALKNDKMNGLAWNGLGVTQTNALVKQFAWTRAIQASNCDASWANLGLLYAQSAAVLGKPAVALARSALLHLQSVNPNNSAMWLGYGLLSAHESSSKEKIKAIESFSCALQVSLDLDALKHLITTVLQTNTSDLANASSLTVKDEAAEGRLLFNVRKYLERDPFDASMWNALGLIQLRLGLTTQAIASFQRALTLASEEKTRRLVEWNLAIAQLQQAKPTIETLRHALALVEQTPLKKSILSQLLQSFQHAVEGHFDHAMAFLKSMQLDSTMVCRFVLALTALYGKDEMDELVQLSKAYLSQHGDHLVVDLFDRFVGNQHANEAEIRSCADAVRMGLSLIDSQRLTDRSVLHQYAQRARKEAFTPTMSYDRTANCILQALNDLLLQHKNQSGSAMKLVRMTPWSPFAYLVAGASCLKSFLLTTKDDTVRNPWLESAQMVLKQGLRVAETTNLTSLQLRWLLVWTLHYLNQPDDASKQAHVALNELEETNATLGPIESHVLRARILAVIDPVQAASAYRDAIQLVQTDQNQLVLLLTELAALYEVSNQLDGAIQVWKSLAAADKATDQQLASTMNYVANLRLALVHHRKQNIKTAKKHAKAAVAAAEKDGATVDASTAAFVEQVIAKC